MRKWHSARRLRGGDGVACVRWPPQAIIAAQADLGVLYDRPKARRRTTASALKWYRLAADKGFGRAQNNLGIMYQNGNGVAQNYPEAVKWYRRAADRDYVEAQYNLGNYVSGRASRVPSRLQGRP